MSGIENPILLDIPEQLETERMILCPFRLGDESAVQESVAESIDEMRPWIPWAETVLEMDQCKAFVRRMTALFIKRERLVFQLWHRESGQLLGNIGYYRLDWSVPRLEIGYYLRTSATGNGYVTEAVRFLTDYGFRALQAERIEMYISARNEASLRVPPRCDYQLEIRLRNYHYDYLGNLSDMMIFSMIRSEWEQRSK